MVEMGNQRWEKDGRGLTPVIATILLVSMVIASIGMVAIVFSNLAPEAPHPDTKIGLDKLYFEDNRTVLKFINSGGDTLETNRLKFIVSGTLENATGNTQHVQYSVSNLSTTWQRIKASNDVGSNKWAEYIWVRASAPSFPAGEVLLLTFEGEGENIHFTSADTTSLVHIPSGGLLFSYTAQIPVESVTPPVVPTPPPDTDEPNTYLVPYTPDPTGDSTPTYSGTATDASSNVVDIEYRVDGGAWTNVDAFAPALTVNFTFTVSPALADGTHTIQARARDSAGNWETTYAQDILTIGATLIHDFEATNEGFVQGKGSTQNTTRAHHGVGSIYSTLNAWEYVGNQYGQPGRDWTAYSTVSVWVWTSSSGVSCQFYHKSGDWAWIESTFWPLTQNGWTNITMNLSELHNKANVQEIGWRVNAAAGNVYFDQVELVI